MKRPVLLESPCAATDISRRQVIKGVATSLAATGSLMHAQTDSSHESTAEEFVQLMTQLSNWNRWGQDDQMGAINLITPKKRRQAVNLVKEGVSFSMARRAELEVAVDAPQPIVSKMTRVGVGAPTTGIGGTGDTFFISYHGYVHTHMDSLCHFLYNGKMYNGYSQDVVTEKGAANNSIINFQHGIITRGIFMDMARHKGVDYLEPGYSHLSGRSKCLGEEGPRQGRIRRRGLSPHGTLGAA